MALIVPAPTAGLIDQVTPVSVLVPLTVARNCCVLLKSTVGVAGVTADTDSFDTIVTVVLFDLLGSAWLVAIAVTFVSVGKSVGAV